ncbi:MAG: diaminopimelate epimerase [Candidatus Krumholzibacteriia bacterium]
MEQPLAFVKMHGAGNDFVMVDGRGLPPARLDAPAIAALCDRRRGIGGDGLIIVDPDRDLDFAMSYYNADGGEADMCGNGARCAVAFARALGLAPGESCRFRTRSGPLAGRWEAGEISVQLTPPRDLRLRLDLGATTPFPTAHAVDTGVPHLVVPVDDVDAVDVARWGPLLRRHPAGGPAGANVDWVAPGAAPGAPHRLRTFERGVEGETLACGTGASAAAFVLCRLGLARSPVALLTRGGDTLTITLEEAADGPRLHLRGPAVVAFAGEVASHG